MKREIRVGRVGIGGSNPVSIQSMTNTPARDVPSTLAQISGLDAAGCQIVRVALPDESAVASFREIVRESPLPVIADIHFDASLAIRALTAGAHGIRINPGNIGGRQKWRDILHLAGERRVPVRIGVNAGSLDKPRAAQADRPLAQRMAESAMEHVRFCEECGFFLVKISLKSSSVRDTVDAYRRIDSLCDYPLHIGVTEAGTRFAGTVKSAVGIGALLLDGIGNTLRVSLTADPLEEVRVARAILRALGLAASGIELVSCPTCARTSIDLVPLVEEVEAELETIHCLRPLTVAVMGCEVNGPGEAAHADVGLAFSRSHGFLFEKGRPMKRIDRTDEALRLLLERVRCLAAGAGG